ncbi:MAG: hypothetical protein ABSG52_14100 [Terriglobales bacterium]|jgi:hypothetical protein
MATKQDVTAAEAQMNRAKNALLAYVQGQQKDINTHKRLLDELKAATDNFFAVLSRLT